MIVKNNKECNVYRQELRVKILQISIQLFKRRGIKDVKMDDIAAALGISKRTLYEIYENKEQLVYEGVKHDKDERERAFLEFARKADNEMEIVAEAIRLNLQDLSQINPIFFVDMNKYEDVVNYLVDKRERQWDKTMEFMKSGVEHGYFLPYIDYNMVFRISNESLMSVMNQRYYEQYTLEEIFRNYIIVFLRGVATEKGIRLMDHYLERLSE